MFWSRKISDGVKLLAKHMVENPQAWKQGAYHYQNIDNRDLNIWTANGVDFIKLEGNDAFTKEEKRYILNAIKQSISNRLKSQIDKNQKQV